MIENPIELSIDSLLQESLVFHDLLASDREELLTKMCEEAKKQGLVKEGYLEAVLEREGRYPTGLETNIIRVAVPHAIDKTHVNRSAIIVAKLKRPVIFKEMGEGVLDVPAEMVFLLAMNAPKAQLKVLQKIVGLFTKEKALNSLKEAASPSEIIQAIKDNIDD
jgi:PTS system galactitol-specific IIA component